MRNIKFRGKCKRGYDYSNGDGFIYGSLLTDGKQAGIVQEQDLSFENKTDDGISSIDDFSFIPVIPETIGQFTGLTDKCGKEIYEGDILQFGSQLGSTDQVKYVKSNAGYLIRDKWGDLQWLYDVVASTNCKIIGNIYDNPELLGKEVQP